MAKLATFTETFTGTTQNPALDGWSNGGITLTGTRLRMATLSDYTGLGSAASNWDLTGSSFTFQAIRPSATDGGQGGFSITTPSQSWEIGWTWSNEYTSSLFSGSYTDHGASLSSPYLRIRENGGTIYWETSNDGVTFTTVRTTATPSGVSSVGFSWYAGGGPSNNAASTSYVEVDNVNTTSTGSSGAAAFTATGTLAATPTKVTVARAAAFSASGTEAFAPSRVTMVGPSQAFTSSGTLTASGTRSTVGAVAYGAAGTLSAAPVVGLRASSPSSATGFLQASGLAKVTVEAAVDLATVWLNPAADLSDGRAFPTLGALTVTTAREGEFRRYTSGRFRTVLRPGSTRTAEIQLASLDREAVAWLELHVGDLLCVRDHVGRKFYGAFLSVPAVEHRYNTEADVTLTLTEITHTEAR